MARIKGAVMTRKRRNKVLKAAKGYWGAKSKHFKMAKQAVMKSGNYAFAGRKMKKWCFDWGGGGANSPQRGYGCQNNKCGNADDDE